MLDLHMHTRYSDGSDEVSMVLEKAEKFCPSINFCWVKGHTSNSDFFSQMNNLADKLAVEASQEYETKKE